MILTQDKYNELIKKLNDSTLTVRTLQADLDFVRGIFAEGGDLYTYTREQQYFWYRTLVRTFFAYVEGSAYNLKQFAYIAGELFRYEFTPEQIMIINEKTPSISKGKAKQSVMKINLMENIKFAFNIFSDVFDIDISIDFSGSGDRSSFDESVAVRNGLMHPKTPEDLYDLPIQKVDHIIKARDWFVDAVEDAFEKGRLSFNDKVTQMVEEFNRLQGLNSKETDE